MLWHLQYKECDDLSQVHTESSKVRIVHKDTDPQKQIPNPDFRKCNIELISNFF